MKNSKKKGLSVTSEKTEYIVVGERSWLRGKLSNGGHQI